MDILEEIKAAKRRSNAELEAIRTQEPTAQGIYKHLKSFISDRFLIDDGFWDDSLSKLADHSIELAFDRSLDGESLKDNAMSCTGATSSETKRALFFITLKKELGLDFDPSFTVTYDNVRDLAEKISGMLLEKKHSTASASHNDK